MADTVTVARPYAKAIFEYALNNQMLSQWSNILKLLTFIINDKHTLQFIQNPIATYQQKIELLMTPYQSLEQSEKKALNNFLALLIQKKRLTIIKNLYKIFETLRAEQEKTLEVIITSFSNLDESQIERLKNSLKTRLQRQVTLKITIDKNLLGGMVIQAGDLVIDGSVREKINRLKTELIA